MSRASGATAASASGSRAAGGRGGQDRRHRRARAPLGELSRHLLNVEPDLDHFAGIVPCGIAEHGVTSLVDSAFRSPWLISMWRWASVRRSVRRYERGPSSHGPLSRASRSAGGVHDAHDLHRTPGHEVEDYIRFEPRDRPGTQPSDNSIEPARTKEFLDGAAARRRSLRPCSKKRYAARVLRSAMYAACSSISSAAPDAAERASRTAF